MNRTALDKPHYGIGFAGAVKRAYLKYARFDGRASRAEYWWFQLLYAPMYGAWALAAGSASLRILLLLCLVVSIVPSLAVLVRRLHDTGHSGWWGLYLLFPFVGGIVILTLTLLPSEPDGARFDR